MWVVVTHQNHCTRDGLQFLNRQLFSTALGLRESKEGGQGGSTNHQTHGHVKMQQGKLGLPSQEKLWVISEPHVTCVLFGW